MSPENEKLLRNVYEAFGKGDIPTLLSLYSDDIAFHVGGRNPVAGLYSGKDEVLVFIGKLMERSGGTFSLQADDFFANQTRGVVLTTERGEREGKSLDQHGAHVWGIEDGKCVSFHGYNEESWDDFWE